MAVLPVRAGVFPRYREELEYTRMHMIMVVAIDSPIN